MILKYKRLNLPDITSSSKTVSTVLKTPRSIGRKRHGSQGNGNIKDKQEVAMLDQWDPSNKKLERRSLSTGRGLRSIQNYKTKLDLDFELKFKLVQDQISKLEDLENWENELQMKLKNLKSKYSKIITNIKNQQQNLENQKKIKEDAKSQIDGKLKLLKKDKGRLVARWSKLKKANENLVFLRKNEINFQIRLLQLAKQGQKAPINEKIKSIEQKINDLTRKKSRVNRQLSNCRDLLLLYYYRALYTQRYANPLGLSQIFVELYNLQASIPIQLLPDYFDNQLINQLIQMAEIRIEKQLCKKKIKDLQQQVKQKKSYYAKLDKFNDIKRRIRSISQSSFRQQDQKTSQLTELLHTIRESLQRLLLQENQVSNSIKFHLKNIYNYQQFDQSIEEMQRLLIGVQEKLGFLYKI